MKNGEFFIKLKKNYSIECLACLHRGFFTVPNIVLTPITIENPLSTDELKENAVRIFPNPAQDQINILLSKEFNGDLKARLYNSSGVLILEKQYQKTYGQLISNIQLGDLPAGIYIFKVSNGGL